ncbi:MAG TPA: iron-sulfur cluster carrier protein ApbC [Bacteroidota bacterium]|nr:iron-sulfur cluster carrier protein ApbC [Bacteroidota bacterium]
MKELTPENVLDALRSVHDPDLHKDIVALNFVKEVKIDGKDLRFTIELTTPSCPARDELKAESEKAIRSAIPGTGKIEISMTSNVTSRQAVQPSPLLTGVKNTIAVASGKGGVGKSTVAVNLAVALAQDGASVGLIDCDVYGPSIPLMFNIHEKPKLHNQKLQPLEKYGVKIMSIGFLVDPMQAVIWRGPMASGAVRQFMSDVEWGGLDYLIFDMPPGTGDIQLTLVQQIPLTGAVIVTTPQEISLADARKGLMMFNKVNVPILGIIENMSYFICSHCGNRENIFDAGGGERASKELRVPFLGEIPIDTSIRIGGDVGRPIVESDPKSPQSQVIARIARNLAAQVSIKNLSQSAAPTIEISLGSPQQN